MSRSILWLPKFDVSNFLNGDQDTNFGWTGFPFVGVNIVFFFGIMAQTPQD
jgi:hypothetical protein